MSRKIICDRCGRDITGLQQLGFIGISFRDPESGELLEENPLQNMDYCPDCISAIRAFISGKPTAQIAGAVSEPEPDPEPDPEPVVRQDEIEELMAKLQLDGDICGKSANIDPKMQNPASTSEPEKEADQKPNKKRVDTGKIAALRKAGWSLQDIAVEMKLTAPGVKYHLSKMGMK